ncbi:MAG: SpoIID/LytB domain-containing protein [Candidatus Desantisbacteria bacterium]
MKKLLGIICLSIILFSSITVDAFVLRVGLKNDVTGVTISATSYFDLIDMHTNQVILTTYGWRNYRIEAENGGLAVEGVGTFHGPIILVPMSNAFGKVDNKAYRGKLEISRTNGARILVVNIIDLEQYLYGVVKCEMSDSFPIEALKAQAIIARTFALSNLKKHQDKGYHLCPLVCCQVYNGVSAESKITTESVDKTRSLVLSYENNLARTFYHSCCGGKTAPFIWKENSETPYLQSKNCPFCKHPRNSSYSWTQRVSFYEIQKAFSTGEIASVLIKEHDESSRAKTILICHSEGNSIINANKFRTVLGYTRVKSTMFTLHNDGQGVVLNGTGYGHGVGLCQWGARGMAEAGYDFKEILGFYYSGVCLQKIVFEEER